MIELRSYRSRYEDFRSKKATIIAVSTDKQATQDRFRRLIGGDFSFVADADHTMTERYGVLGKSLLGSAAKRVTFVLGTDGNILHIDRGKAAMNPDGALAACPIP